MSSGIFFFHGCVALMGLGLLIVEVSRSHAVGLSWKSDWNVAQTSTWQHTKLTRDIHAPAGFETAIPAIQQPQTHALHGAATAIGPREFKSQKKCRNQSATICNPTKIQQAYCINGKCATFVPYMMYTVSVPLALFTSVRDHLPGQYQFIQWTNLLHCFLLNVSEKNIIKYYANSWENKNFAAEWSNAA